MVRTLYRSNQDAYLAGVCGGLAEYYEQDSTFWRLGFVTFLICTGLMPGLFVYMIAWLLVPKNPLIQYEDVS